MKITDVKPTILNDLESQLNVTGANFKVNKNDPEALKEACKGMESIFLNIMLKEMRKTIPKSALLPNTMAKDIYTTLFDQHLSQEMAKAGKGIGIAEMLFDYFSNR